jgi:aryl-alcohol dehydrogenase-like predicted oxidoreductase
VSRVRTVRSRRLGADGPTVSAIGLGCMGMTGLADIPGGTYGPADATEAIDTIRRAIDGGVTLLDTAELYGPYTNEELVGRAIRGRRDTVTVATKFGVDRGPGVRRPLDGRPERVRRSCEGSLRRLGVEVLDLYYLHRVDPLTPIEETVGAMARLVEAGMVRHLGLSMVSADSLRRAHRVHPVAAVQSEYSLLCREPEADVMPACRELGVGFVPYSPLARGLLTGTIHSLRQLDEKDMRRRAFAQGQIEASLATVDAVRRVAKATGSTPAQVALRWLLEQGDDVVPIPGTKRAANLVENLGALEVGLSPQDVAQLGRRPRQPSTPRTESTRRPSVGEP